MEDVIQSRELCQQTSLCHYSGWQELCGDIKGQSELDSLRVSVKFLQGFDQTINLILDETHERVYSPAQGVEQVVLGLHIVRGDNICVVGEIDEDIDSRLELHNMKADPINPVPHGV